MPPTVTFSFLLFSSGMHKGALALSITSIGSFGSGTIFSVEPISD